MRFGDLAIGAVFSVGGTIYRKRSTRTADLAGYKNTWFYFRQSEIVNPRP